jgi:primosomal protein N' (replication factor Y)
MTKSANRIARVTLVCPPFAELSYALPEYLPDEAFLVGQRVVVPLGKGLRVGVVAGFEQEGADGVLNAETALRKEDFVLKALVWPLERKPLLSAAYLDLVTQLANRQTESVGRILGAILPAGLRTARARLRFFTEGRPREIRPGAIADMSPDEAAELGELWMQGRAEVSRAGLNPLDGQLCILAFDPPWPVRPVATAQIALLEFLHEQGIVTRRKVRDAFGKGGESSFATLVRRGLVRILPAEGVCAETDFPGPPLTPSPQPGKSPPLVLTPRQREVLEPLLAAAASGTAGTRLLFGITGSGKTAVYLELARAVLERGRSVLLLAPEVALALKLWADAAAALPLSLLPGDRRHLFHGYQSAGSREALFHLLGRTRESGDSRLIVGTRSALLLPLDNIGLIVLDEEHDASFKQDEGLNYQAKEVAWYRAQSEGALLLMGSATPDVKSFHAAREGRIPLHTLPERVGGGSLPEVRLVPLPRGGSSAGANAGGKGVPLLSPQSVDALNAVVERGEQAIILLNRRGYAPLMYCLSCGTVAKCPQCEIALAYHKGRERLLCHYCGWSVPYPSPCSSCRGMNFLPLGEGTEKLEEYLASILPPGAKVLRLDRDSTRRPGRMEEILAAFARKEASVLVGTQMLSKGHHFPDVTLAIVADADLGLNLPDYRAAERTFQLLVQSAGRAGRGDKPGLVLVQTRDPAHYCWEFVRNADYEGFFERELALRKRRAYPPFVRLALVRISCPAEMENAQDAVNALGGMLRASAREFGVTLLGPAPAPLPFLKGRRRWHCLIKGSEWAPLRGLFAAALEKTRNGPLRLRIDLDPVNML